MSFSVDDLVSSLSTSHIGQEAMDLAALQAQLAATLFCGHGSSGSNHQQKARSSYACPSPIRTPSTSFSIDTAMAGMTPMSSRRGSCSVVASNATPRAMASPMPYHQVTSSFEDAMEEDMVEELLMPSSPAASAPTHMPYHHQQQYHVPSSPAATSSFFTSAPPQSQTQPSSTHHHPQYQTLDSQSGSLFATTDPFYLAQLQASQQPSNAPQSVFSQNGRMSQGSRFTLSMHAQAAF